MAAELRERNMRFVLDGVFNHTGDECSWFDPKLRGPTGDWYTPGPKGGYMAWWDVHTLPKLEFSTPAVVDEIYAGEGSVTRSWLRGPHGADGWRLDVPACLGEGGYETGNLRHLRGILDAAREANPEAYVFGEHFEPAGAWLDARVHDAVMNYAGFTFPTAEWLAGRDYQDFETPVDAGLLSAAWAAHRVGRCVDQRLVAFNLLSSHDVPRLLTRLGEDRDLHRLAHVLLLTFPGVPCVYYGDEVGMAGGEDPDCRRTFPWDEGSWDGATHELVRTLSRLRRTHPALVHGDLQAYAPHPDVVRLVRVAGEDVAVVLVNRGEGRRRVELNLAGFGFQDEELVDVLDGRTVGLAEGRARVSVGPRKARVLVEPSTLT
jgi:alpha-glucosidase